MQIEKNRIRNIVKDDKGVIVKAEIKVYAVWDNYEQKEVNTGGKGFHSEKDAKKWLTVRGLWKGKHNPRKRYSVTSVWKEFDGTKEADITEGAEPQHSH